MASHDMGVPDPTKLFPDEKQAKVLRNYLPEVLIFVGICVALMVVIKFLFYPNNEEKLMNALIDSQAQNKVLQDENKRLQNTIDRQRSIDSTAIKYYNDYVKKER